MSKKEASTDLWVHDLLKEAGIELDAQGSEIKELDEALKTASKRGTGKVGKPEYVGVVKDFIIVIEDKAKLENHIKETENGAISTDVDDVTDYAVNGALFYAKHLIKNTSFAKAIAIGVSGDEKRHRITPLYVEDTEPYTRLNDIESFVNFNEKNIQDYYEKEILHEDISEKKLKEILRDAAELHEELRIYGSLGTREKPIVVSGILLALDEIQKGNFSISSLVGDKTKTDGEKIYDAIKAKFDRDPIKQERKKDKVLSQFNIIKDSEILNTVNKTLAKTPLKRYAEFLNENIYKSIKYTTSSEDYLGRFYSEFMSYGGGDGQDLGIILTPKHITDLFCDLAELKKDTVVLDPCCGTAGFLVAAMHHMLEKAEDEADKIHIRQQQLHGIEIEEYMFTIAVTNMILRGDGKSNIENQDFLSYKSGDLQRKGATVGMINPPYSMAKKKKNAELYEINFIKKMLDSLVVGGKGIAIVPQSSMTGKSKEEQQIKEEILKNHTLEGTIMLQKDTFYEVGVIPCIAVFTAGVPHPKNHVCKFINFEDYGFKVAPHIGLEETVSAKDKKQHLLDVWFNRMEANTKFCVKTTATAEDEWLHSFYYFNDEIPTDKDFEKTVGDYLTFEFSMIMQGRKYLFENDASEALKKNFKSELTNKEWREFKISDVFNVCGTITTKPQDLLFNGTVPRITCSATNNALDNFYRNKATEKGGVITIDSATIGFVSYQGQDFIATDHVEKLESKNSAYISRFIGLFEKQSIDKATLSKYGYGYKFAQQRIKRQTILLPVTLTGEIDFDFMESYIKEVEEQKIEEYRMYASNCVRECLLKENQNAEKLEEKEWKPFYLKEIFTSVQRGKRLTKDNQKLGTVPYVSSSALNNGVDNYISNDIGVRKFENCLSLANSGSVGSCFYEPFEFVASDHVTHLKNPERNKYQYLFEATLLNRLSEKYNFNREINDERISKEIILLPIDSSGNPDYEYMERYIKKVMQEKYNAYLSYKKNENNLKIKNFDNLQVAEKSIPYDNK